MTMEKRAIDPYIVPIAEDEKDLYYRQRTRPLEATEQRAAP
jgi:hypothetical protein